MTRHADLPPAPLQPAASSTRLSPSSPFPPLPAEWMLERFVKQIGKGPLAARRALDALAAMPLIGRVVRLFSSVVFGIIILTLIAAYIAIGSGLPEMRSKLEMTDLQFFDAWPMRILLILLVLDLTIVTLRRIPLTLFKVGVWTVHIGILTLVGGCVWYFSHKTEGSVRIYLGKTVDSYFDATERSLYAFGVAPDGAIESSTSTMTPLKTLPIFYEHLRSNGKPLNLTLPPVTLENVTPALKGATLRIVGYYPYAEMVTAWQTDPSAVADANGDAPNPAVRVSMALEGVSGGQWLVGKSPAARVLDQPGAPFGVEYLYHPPAEHVAELKTEFTGPVGLTVRVPKLHVSKSYTVEPGQTIAVDGTPYTLTMGGQTTLPLISKGYEGSMSNSLMVKVDRKDAEGKTFEFNRMALSRYPERSPDFVAGPDGKQKRVQDRVDNDIEIGFQDAERAQFWIVDQLDRPMELIYRHAGGAVDVSPITVGKSQVVKVGTVPMTVTVLERANRVIPYPVPRIIPPEQRERSITAMDAMQNSVVELELKKGDFERKGIFVPFSQFAQVGNPPSGRQPTVVEVPGAGQVGFLLSTTRRELPSEVTLADFKAEKYPGATTAYANYISTLVMKDKKTGATETLVAQLNEPAENHGLSYFQAAWDGDDHAPAARRFSVIGVANRPGVWVMVAGALLMISGIGFAFYVKPILLNKKKQELAAWTAARKRAAEAT